MKLFKALVGLAAAASVIPLKVEKVEENGKKTVRISSLTWKAEYTSATPEDDATLNVDLMGGLKEIVKKKEKSDGSEEETEEFIEFDEILSEEAIDSEESSDVEEIVETPDFDLADRISGEGIIRWADLEESDSNEELVEAEEEDIETIENRFRDLMQNADDLMWDVVDTVVEFGKASTSMIQRKFKIGYGRAAKMIDLLTNHKFISYPEGSKARDVLITVEQWNKIKVQFGKAAPAEVVVSESVETVETVAESTNENE